MSRSLVSRQVVIAVFLLSVAAAGCRPPAAGGPEMRVEDAWGWSTPQMFKVAAFYMRIQNKGAETDRLMGGASTLCGTIELHETYQTDDGVSGMRPVPGGFIEIPPGGQVELKPGSFHIMCIDKEVDFNAGDTLPLTLFFEKSGDKAVNVSIRDTR